jgi:hypothetical protein
MAVGDDLRTVTFRIPRSLKKQLEDRANKEQVTETIVLIRALQNEIDDKPPRWFEEWQTRRNP